MAASLRYRRREQAQAMAIGIERHEGVAEIHGAGLLGNRQASPTKLNLLIGSSLIGEPNIALATVRFCQPPPSGF
jgi:hypothetical protein